MRTACAVLETKHFTRTKGGIISAKLKNAVKDSSLRFGSDFRRQITGREQSSSDKKGHEQSSTINMVFDELCQLFHYE